MRILASSNKSKLVLLVALLIANSILIRFYCSSSLFSIHDYTFLYRFSRLVSQSCDSSFNGGFITLSFSLCAGLGNELWRYASLKAIATQINRTAYFPPLPCMDSYIKELEDVFPHFSKEILLMVSNGLRSASWALFFDSLVVISVW